MPLLKTSRPTQAELRHYFDYLPETGQLRWRVRRGPALPGFITGRKDGGGYYQTGVHGRLYRVHILIWVWHYGTWPVKWLDHINRIRDDNRIENLREANPHENSANVAINAKKNSTTTSKWKGVNAVATGRFISRIGRGGARRHLGMFSEEGDAAMAYNEAALQLDGDRAILNNYEGDLYGYI